MMWTVLELESINNKLYGMVVIQNYRLLWLGLIYGLEPVLGFMVSQ